MRNEWWRGGAIYQVYPRSFFDHNNDGIGDIKGITEKLEYIASLGVDAVWISPFFKSPMKDFGYDVSDYKDIDPMFGSLSDFDELIKKADNLGLHIMIDMVISHTSDEHEWFKESRKDKTNPKADWYVWADPKPDGSPPNNWLSIFGGSAWEWDTGRRQYYMHNFLSSQPDLNFHNPEVRAAVMDAAKFWLDRGVKGFRMDTVNFYFHDEQLRDNPPNEGPPLDYVPESNPYTMQKHLYDKTRPENLKFLEDLRKLIDSYPDAATVGEMGAQDSLGLIGTYTEQGKRLNMVYTFHMLNDAFSAKYIRETVEYLEARIGDGWPCWALSNHDVPRAVTRWNKHNHDNDKFARFLLTLLGSLRGTICLYQGEELGLPEAEVPYEKLQDPYGIRFWPEFKGRDGCRTPMVWSSNEEYGGFNDGSNEPWLPVYDKHLDLNVEKQDNISDSTLSFFRKFLKWRSNREELKTGSIEFFGDNDEVLSFIRSSEESKIICCFNCSNQHQTIDLSSFGKVKEIFDTTLNPSTSQEELTLPPYSSFFGEIIR